jgi:hypothetical protein
MHNSKDQNYLFQIYKNYYRQEVLHFMSDKRNSMLIILQRLRIVVSFFKDNSFSPNLFSFNVALLIAYSPPTCKYKKNFIVNKKREH